MVDLGFLAAAFSISAAVWMGLRHAGARASVNVWREFSYVQPVGKAARNVLICDSCDGTLGLHNPECPRLTGRELAPITDVRRVP